MVWVPVGEGDFHLFLRIYKPDAAMLACAASSTMWLYAAASESALHGGIAMLVWCLGTVPAMGLFSWIGNFVPRKGAVWFQRLSMVLMLAIGLRMTWNGLLLITG